MNTGLLEVFGYAMLTALCTGLGALVFAWKKDLSRTQLAKANAVAAALMIAASFGLIYEALRVQRGVGFDLPHWISGIGATYYNIIGVSVGVIAGLFFILRSEKKLSKYEHISINELTGANAKKALLILGVMTLHSFSEGVAIGVSFGPNETFGVFVALALALHNIPEGLAIASVMVPRGMPWRKASLRSIFSSLPQPLMAIPAFLFVQQFAPFLPVGLGFAAGAMLWMSFSELLPEAMHDAKNETVATIVTISILAMIVFQTLIG